MASTCPPTRVQRVAHRNCLRVMVSTLRMGLLPALPLTPARPVIRPAVSCLQAEGEVSICRRSVLTCSDTPVAPGQSGLILMYAGRTHVLAAHAVPTHHDNTRARHIAASQCSARVLREGHILVEQLSCAQEILGVADRIVSVNSYVVSPCGQQALNCGKCVRPMLGTTLAAHSPGHRASRWRHTTRQHALCASAGLLVLSRRVV